MPINKKIYLLFIIFFSFQSNFCMNTITIQPFQKHNLNEIKTIILQAVIELQIIPCNSLEELTQEVEKTGELADLEHIEQLYTNNKGIFLVMVQNDKVLGMGAIKYLNEESCELKRMFFDQKQRGNGYGSTMLKDLLIYARNFGYKKIRLDVYNPATQQAAVSLYKKFEFYEIEPYKQTRAQLFMEKIL